MKIVEGWETLGDKDQTEGRGGTYHVSFSLTEAEALWNARGKGAQGTDGYVRKVEFLYMESDNKVRELGPVEPLFASEEAILNYQKIQRIIDFEKSLSTEERAILKSILDTPLKRKTTR